MDFKIKQTFREELIAMLFLKYKFIYFNWRLIILQCCIGFAIHQHESATAKRYSARQARPREYFSQQIRSFLRPQRGRQHCGLQAAHPGESAAFQRVGVGRSGPSWGMSREWAGQVHS